MTAVSWALLALAVATAALTALWLAAQRQPTDHHRAAHRWTPRHTPAAIAATPATTDTGDDQ